MIRRDRKATEGPFAYMANVRLTKVRCWAGGLAPGKKHHFSLVHSGRETFVSSAGHAVTVAHEPSTLDYAYICQTEIDPAAKGFTFDGTEELKPLVGTKFALLGPFTTWYVLVKDKEDRKAATSLRVEFDLVYEGFDAHLPSVDPSSVVPEPLPDAHPGSVSPPSVVPEPLPDAHPGSVSPPSVVPEPPPEQIARYGATVRVGHVSTGRTLHSHAYNYRHRGTSGQQQVTCYELRDDNDSVAREGARRPA